MNRFERWSRRKLNRETLDDGEDMAVGEEIKERPVEGHDEPAGDSQASQTDAPTEAHDLDASSVEPAPGSLDDTLPDPDTLPPGSDIKAFLEPGVSQGLRRRALRRLFSGDNYGIRDGLDDYDDDYREKLKPLASELAQRMRQWTRPVEPHEEDTDVDETLPETPRDTARTSLEDTSAAQEVDQEVAQVTDKQSDETSNKLADTADVDSAEVEDPSSPVTLDEGRVGVRHQIDQH